jgi:hypothetical protein
MPPESSIAPPARFLTERLDTLRARCFAHNRPIHIGDGLTFATSGRWHVLSEECNGADKWPASRSMGQPGLWKWVQNGALPHRVFEIPAWVVSDQPEDDRLDASGPAAFESLVAWALETRDGRVPPGWLMPAADTVKSWIPRGALTVQAKGHVRQGELILRPDCWALRMPVVPSLAEDLPEPRRLALEGLVHEAQRHWAMVRLGVPADASPASLMAEVDITGAPHSELLFSAGLDALRHLVAWLVETADVLADPTVAIVCLAPGGDNNPSSVERKTS